VKVKQDAVIVINSLETAKQRGECIENDSDMELATQAKRVVILAEALEKLMKMPAPINKYSKKVINLAYHALESAEDV